MRDSRSSLARRWVTSVVGRLNGRLWLRVEVTNLSMAPSFEPGDRLTAVRRWRPVRAGDVVVLRDPREPTRWILKRCQSRARGRLELRGDNASDSTDSRVFGPVPARDVRWVVVGERKRPTAR